MHASFVDRNSQRLADDETSDLSDMASSADTAGSAHASGESDPVYEGKIT